ncbi:MAG: ketol-acid reductoisomerase [Nitrososphaerota archaeon]|jgi:ketol-acid reductoisomerase|uniref:ketol-acid reductoisomerase n=1 Tax=Candidatus Bathycorpusculum sp. TaxID=2994959 RepID=UPI002816EAE7|nr:ketol-acid reductoisomerase [Candidatus Termiticorpusculum sp.]MDR0459843.1 ketol-acid reductoisomerase [Nitrososphaerota archaeon]
MVELDFGGVKENVVTRKEFTIEQAQKVLQNEVIATLGYGIQGRSQALNMRDQGIKVIVGQRQGSKTWELAVKDGWVPGQTLFTVEAAAYRGTIKMFLLTDAGQKEEWSQVKKSLKKGDALYVSHGFSVVFKEQTGVVPPVDIDVILVAPKGSGTSVRRNFLDGSGINSSFAVFQNATGRAEERAKAMGIAIGSGYLFPTTFEKETYSDLTGERGTLMGALAGIIEAQYATLREHGHSPSEAFNETVEELTQSLIRLVDENGMDWMYNNCSETARIGALRWKERFRSATKPVFESLYELTAAGEESRVVLERSKEVNYKQKLADELAAMGNSELWRAGVTVRSLRPTKQKKE